MSVITWILDQATRETLLEGIDAKDAEQLVAALLPPSRELYCAAPLGLLHLPAATADEIARGPCLRIAGYSHDSLVEGPGRRSVALLTGCDLGCRGCAVPHLHRADGGRLVPADVLADLLLDPAHPRDGVSILGGEPFQQPEGLLALIRALRARTSPPILCYSGYTFEALCRRASREPAIGAALDAIDVLVDGPYVQALAGSGGPWTGSGNQRVINLVATRQAGRVVLLDVLR